MATVHTMLRTAVQGMTSPGEVSARFNELRAAEIPAGMFVTCFFILLDPKSGRLRYANAGQDLPYRRQSDGVSELWATGMPLGMMPGSRYEEYEVTITPGESLLFYSDGLVEAHTPGARCSTHLVSRSCSKGMPMGYRSSTSCWANSNALPVKD